MTSVCRQVAKILDEKRCRSKRRLYGAVKKRLATIQSQDMDRTNGIFDREIRYSRGLPSPLYTNLVPALGRQAKLSSGTDRWWFTRSVK